MRREISAALSIFIAGCAQRMPETPAAAATVPNVSAPASGAPSGGVDHVIIAIDSLERGIAQLREKTGVTPVFGGTHPGRGTQNALISLGPGVYLELLAPNPADSAGPTVVRNFAHMRGLTPSGWAMHTRNADSLRTFAVSKGLNASDVRAGSRVKDDGSTLAWKTVNPWGVNRWLLPFFIEWSPTSAHPSATSPTGCTLAEVALFTFSPDSLKQMLDAVSVKVPVTAAQADRMSVTLDCPKGRVTLP